MLNKNQDLLNVPNALKHVTLLVTIWTFTVCYANFVKICKWFLFKLNTQQKVCSSGTHERRKCCLGFFLWVYDTTSTLMVAVAHFQVKTPAEEDLSNIKIHIELCKQKQNMCSDNSVFFHYKRWAIPQNLFFIQN